MEHQTLPDEFCSWYGTVHDIRAKVGLDPASIRTRVGDLLARRAVSAVAG